MVADAVLAAIGAAMLYNGKPLAAVEDIAFMLEELVPPEVLEELGVGDARGVDLPELSSYLEDTLPTSAGCCRLVYVPEYLCSSAVAAVPRGFNGDAEDLAVILADEEPGCAAELLNLAARLGSNGAVVGGLAWWWSLFGDSYRVRRLLLEEETSGDCSTGCVTRLRVKGADKTIYVCKTTGTLYDGTIDVVRVVSTRPPKC